MATSYEKPPSKPTNQPGPTLPTVASRLAGLRTQLNLWFVLEGLAYLCWSALALAATSFLLDYFFRLDSQQRTFLLLVMAGTLLVIFFRRVIAPVSTPLSDDGLLLEVERRHPELAESLISAVQFKRMEDRLNPNTSRAMVQATIERGAEAAQKVRFTDVLNSAGFVKNVAMLLVAALLVVGLVAASSLVPHIAIWFQRNVLLKNVSWPQKTYLEIVRAENNVIRIPRGDDYTLEVKVRPTSEIVPERVFVDFADGRSPLGMKLRPEHDTAVSLGTFEVVLANVIQPFKFRVRGGDERTDWVQVELVEPPAIEDLKLEITYPQYAGGKTEPLPAGRGPYFVLPGATLSLSGQGNKPLAKAELACEGVRVPLKISSSNKVTGSLTAEQLKTGQYAIELTDTEGLIARRPTTFGLRQRPDREPRVRAKLTGIGGMVTDRARIPLSGRVTDDFSLSKVAVPYSWSKNDEAEKKGQGELPLPSVKLEERTIDTEFDDVLDLEPLQIPANSGITFYVAAADNDDYPDEPNLPVQPNLGKSTDFSIRVVTDEELRSDLLRREKEQRQEFERLTKQQDELLTFSRELVAQLGQSEGDFTPDQKQRLAQIPKQQKLIGTNSGGISKRLSSMVVEIANNRLDDPRPDSEGKLLEPSEDDIEGQLKRSLGKRVRTKIVEPLVSLQVTDFPEALKAVEAARRISGDLATRREVLDTVVEKQESLLAAMREILSAMAQAEGFQELVNGLYEVDKEERELLLRTKKAKEEREKGILEGAGASNEKPSDSETPAEPTEKPAENPQNPTETKNPKSDDPATENSVPEP